MYMTSTNSIKGTDSLTKQFVSLTLKKENILENGKGSMTSESYYNFFL